MALPDHFDFSRVVFKNEEKNAPGSFARSLSLAETCIDSGLNYGFVFSYPGVLAAMVCRWLLPLSDLSVFYLARLFQGALLVSMMAMLLRLIEQEPSSCVGKKAAWVGIVFLLLTPIGLQQSFGVSADTVTNAFALLVVYWLWKPSVGRSDSGVFFVSALAAVFTKPPLLAWLVPLVVWLQVNKKIRKKATAVFWGLTAAVLVLSLLISSISVSKTVPHESARPKEQIAFLAKHPVGGMVVLWRGIIERFERPGDLSGNLGALDFGPTRAAISLQQIYQVCTVLALVLPFLLTRHVRRRRGVGGYRVWLGDIFFFAGVLASLFLVALFLFLYWSSPLLHRVDGMQVRYLVAAYLVAIGLAGFRADTLWQSRANGRAFPPWATLLLHGGVVVALLAYLVERNFSNLVRYF
jgi:hypothetical protein